MRRPSWTGVVARGAHRVGEAFATADRAASVVGDPFAARVADPVAPAVAGRVGGPGARLVADSGAGPDAGPVVATAAPTIRAASALGGPVTVRCVMWTEVLRSGGVRTAIPRNQDRFANLPRVARDDITSRDVPARPAPGRPGRCPASPPLALRLARSRATSAPTRTSSASVSRPRSSRNSSTARTTVASSVSTARSDAVADGEPGVAAYLLHRPDEVACHSLPLELRRDPQCRARRTRRGQHGHRLVSRAVTGDHGLQRVLALDQPQAAADDACRRPRAASRPPCWRGSPPARPCPAEGPPRGRSRSAAG